MEKISGGLLALAALALGSILLFGEVVSMGNKPRGIRNNKPRGIRNNNPGNIRKGQPWQGLAPVQSDSAFSVFESPEYGLRALGKTLLTYQRKYGIRTIREAITRWAPPSENNTDAYVLSVAQHVGASPDAPLDFSKKVVLVPMMEAITRHENGMQPYSVAVLDTAARLAGAA